MKLLKTLTVAIATAVTLALCATSAKAYSGLTTNYDTVTFSATVTTSQITLTTNRNSILTEKTKITTQKFVTKDLLNLLTNADFAGTNFPADSKLVAGWDGNWNGDLLVVDKSGTNVLYDATTHTANSTNYVAINLYNQTGTPNINGTVNLTNVTGTTSTVWYNNGTFKLFDRNGGINIAGTGPCTEHFNLKIPFANDVGAWSWSDSQSFNMYGADEINGSSEFPGTLTGSITVRGSGKGFPEYLIDKIVVLGE